jgi:pyruvate formate lyase activating enzyme
VKVRCEICPKECVIGPGQSGDCRIRVNIDGKVRAVTYGYPSAVHVDPIEKKPMNHFLPGSTTFSLATVGCNLHCKNCQNWDLSQRNPEDAEASYLPPERVPALAAQYGCTSVAYTYTDPVVYYEYALDSCIRVREAGLKNVLVTAGYINEKPMRELYAHVDGATIDLKGITEEIYREVCGATLKPVLNTLVAAKSMGVAVEVSNLLIPTLNDSDDAIGALCRWVKENMGWETPFHFLGFYPQYRMQHLPPTSAETLGRARDIALAAGLKYVYVGNVLLDGAGDTLCPSCRRLLMRRVGHQLVQNRVADGRCPDCGAEVYGLWK